MKLETFLLLLKGVCLTAIPIFSTFGGGLSFLKMDTVFGVPVALLQLICSAITAGAGGLLAFISTSMADHLAKNGNIPPILPKP